MFEYANILCYPVRTCAINAQPFIDYSMVYYRKDLIPDEQHFVLMTDTIKVSPYFRELLDKDYRIVIELSINHLDLDSDFAKEQTENYFMDYRTGHIVCIPPLLANQVPSIKGLKDITLLPMTDFKRLDVLLKDFNQD